MLINDIERGTTSAGRVADVLLAVADSTGSVGVSKLARDLGLSKAVVYRILRSLVDRGLVTDGSGQGLYSLGPAALRLGARALGSFDLRAAAMPVLRELQLQTGETTTISVLVGLARSYLDQVVSSQEIRMTVELGTAYPLHAGSSSKALLAFAPEDVQEAILNSELKQMTEHTITDVRLLRAQLEEIRSTGVAISRGERQNGSASIAAPVFGIGGTAIGSISVCGPRDRLDMTALQALAPDVRAAARSITLGATRHDT